MNAETCMLAGGIVSFLVTLHWVRSRDLREKYAVAWLGVAVLLLLCGLFPKAIMAIADASRLSYPAAVLFFALSLIYVFALSVSVTLTRHARARARALQNIALLEERVRRLERERDGSRAREEDPISVEYEHSDSPAHRIVNEAPSR